MILQALVQYYEALAEKGELARPGWGPAKVSYALYLGEEGEIEQIVSVKREQVRKDKSQLVPREMILPAQVKRSSGVEANFFCDNAGYVLGVDGKGKKERTLACFEACKELHETILSEVDEPAARALLAYFRRWEPEKAMEHPALLDCLEELLSGANLVFRFDGAYLHEIPAIRRAWQAHYDADDDAPKMPCLVTGEIGPVAQLHPAIKGVQGAQTSGASLVSFNAPALCSYDREQGLNAPTGRYAAFAYGAALNALLSDREHVIRMGDTTVVCWAENGVSAYQIFLEGALYGMPTVYSEADLQKMAEDLARGDPVLFEESRLDPKTTFYILGLSPNAARLSVRFFLKNSFGNFLANVNAHHKRMEIARPIYDKFETLPLWKLLEETVNKNSRDKKPLPGLAGDTLWAILNNARYPATLLSGVTLRIRAEHEVTRGRAAILKAYYLKNTSPDVPEEVLRMSLNEQSTHIPYTLGRLFSVLEAIQQAANPGINTTIKDKYFNSAASIPGVIFPILVNLAQKHLKKLRVTNKGLHIHYEKQLGELMTIIGENYPAHQNLQQQGAFQLGYYAQTTARYQKKEDN